MAREFNGRTMASIHSVYYGFLDVISKVSQQFSVRRTLCLSVTPQRHLLTSIISIILDLSAKTQVVKALVLGILDKRD